MLKKISGAEFSIASGDGSSGIAVGTSAEFPALGLSFDLRSRLAREDYRLRSHPRGVWIIGASTRGVSHGVWDLLHRLGYRQFFPGETWEVVPSIGALSIEVDALESPSYKSRRIWFSHGAWGYNEAPFKDWEKKNRLGGSVLLSSGHAYAKIVRKNADEFAHHPEYLGLVGGKRTSNKLCISNPGLRELVVEDALRAVNADPQLDSVSMEPSDGAGWCECDRCRAMGSISDRAVTLANAVAAHPAFQDRLVGMYAYNQHAPPPSPSVPVRSNVAVNVATAFIPGGAPVEALLDGWRARGASVGIREYFSVNAWDRDAPGRSRASNTDYVTTSIPRSHQHGARFFSAESGDNWGPNGLGYYLAARVLWDVREGAQKQALIDDFLQRAFGEAREPMREFYALIDGARQPLLSDDLIGRMYRSLEAAQAKTRDASVLRRIDALVLYTRYAELFHDYSAARGEARQPAFDALLDHAYRIRRTSMVHAKALHKTLYKKDRSVTLAKDRTFEERPFAREDFARFLSGAKTRAIAAFEPRAFVSEPSALKIENARAPVNAGPITTRGDVSLAAVVTDPAQPIRLSVASGFFGPARSYKDAEIELYSWTGKSIERRTIPQDGAMHALELRAPAAGTYRIEVRERKRGAKIDWPSGAAIAFLARESDLPAFHGRWSLSFYVPAGTKIVGGFANGAGVLKDSSGRVVATFTPKPGYFSVPVASGEDGKLWWFEKSAGERSLMTVPPYLFRAPAEAIAPR